MVEHIQALDDPSKIFTKNINGTEIRVTWCEVNGKYVEMPIGEDLEKYRRIYSPQVSPQELVSFIIGLTPLDLPKDIADFCAGKDLATGEKIDRRILFACLFLPEVGDQILKKVGKNSDKLIALAEKEFKANKDVIKKEYQAAVEKSGKNLDELIDEIKTEVKSIKPGKLKFKADEANIHFKKHGKEIMDALGKSKYGLKDYINDANYIVENGKYVSELNGFIQPLGGKGSAKYAFVGLDRRTGNITTLHIKTVSELSKKHLV